MSSIFAAIAAVVAAVGGTATVVIALSGWLARVIANRIAQQDRARVDAEIERLRASLARDSAAVIDARTRQREVYTRLASALRVFVDSGEPTADAKSRFLQAYDDACIWAADPVVHAVEELIDQVQQRPLDQERTKSAYARTISAMRADAGHAGSVIDYRFVKF